MEFFPTGASELAVADLGSLSERTYTAGEAIRGERAVSRGPRNSTSSSWRRAKGGVGFVSASFGLCS
jgi:hypothetical protein